MFRYASNHPLNFGDPNGLGLSWFEALARYTKPSLSPFGSSRDFAGEVVEKSFSDVDQGQQPGDFRGFRDAVLNAPTGTSDIELSQTFVSPTSPEGRLQFYLNGTLTKGLCGEFEFEGRITASDDEFDFDPTTGDQEPRHPIAEFSTVVGTSIPGKPFTYRFRGSRKVQASSP